MIKHGIDDIANLLPHDRPVQRGGTVAVPTTMQRASLAKQGLAMPDGSYYIRNRQELEDAIKAIGRGGADHDVIRKFCMKRAADMGLSSLIPDTWNPDGSLKHQMPMTVEEFLEHFGVKGMHWGVRKAEDSGGSSGPSAKQVAKADKKFAKKQPSGLDIYNAAAKATNEKHVDRINNKAQYKNADFTHDSPLRQKYYAEHEKAFEDEYRNALDAYGTNASGTKKWGLQDDGNGNLLITLVDAQHDSAPTAFRVKTGPKGHILGYEISNAVSHADVEEFLEHFGVKGMHWGVHMQRELELHTRIANGTASHLDKARAAAHMSPIAAAKHHGSLTSYSKERARLLQESKDRIKAGKPTALDRFNSVVSYTPEDLLRGVTRHPRADKEAAYHADVDAFLEHFGVKGMKWGVRRSATSSGPSPVSADHATAAALKARVRVHGVSSLSNDELKTLVDRLGLEDRHGKLTPEAATAGAKFEQALKKGAGDFAKQQAKQFAGQYAAKGAQHIGKLIITATLPSVGRHVLG